MGKSYSEKVKARQSRKSDHAPKRIDRRKKSSDRERENKFPVAPAVVILIVIALITATVVLYNTQNGNDEGRPNGPDTGNVTGRPLYASIGLETLGGGIIALDQHRGKIVLLDMFATWCGPCRYQVGELSDLRTRFSTDDLVILSVDVDLRETLSDVREFKSGYPDATWNFAVSTPDFNTFFPAESIPTLYILNGDSEVVTTHTGLTQADDLEKEINYFLSS